MQKNRTAVAAGILALALIVGGFALWNSQKASNAPVTANGPVLGNTPDTAGKDPLGPNDTETPAITNETDMPTSVEVKPNEGTTGKSNTPGTTTAVIPETHTVQLNETLRDIAKRYYGDPIYSADIERVNNIEDANHITVGTKLTLPRREELESDTPATAPANQSGNNGTSEQLDHQSDTDDDVIPAN